MNSHIRMAALSASVLVSMAGCTGKSSAPGQPGGSASTPPPATRAVPPSIATPSNAVPADPTPPNNPVTTPESNLFPHAIPFPSVEHAACNTFYREQQQAWQQARPADERRWSERNQQLQGVLESAYGLLSSESRLALGQKIYQLGEASLRGEARARVFRDVIRLLEPMRDRFHHRIWCAAQLPAAAGAPVSSLLSEFYIHSGNPTTRRPTLEQEIRTLRGNGPELQEHTVSALQETRAAEAELESLINSFTAPVLENTLTQNLTEADLAHRDFGVFGPDYLTSQWNRADHACFGRAEYLRLLPQVQVPATSLAPAYSGTLRYEDMPRFARHQTRIVGDYDVVATQRSGLFLAWANDQRYTLQLLACDLFGRSRTQASGLSQRHPSQCVALNLASGEIERTRYQDAFLTQRGAQQDALPSATFHDEFQARIDEVRSAYRLGHRDFLASSPYAPYADCRFNRTDVVVREVQQTPPVAPPASTPTATAPASAPTTSAPERNAR